MYIRKLTYKKEDVDCKLCTEYRGKKHPCPHDVCPFIAERIEAGAVTYWDAVNAMISPQYRFARRLPKLAAEWGGELRKHFSKERCSQTAMPFFAVFELYFGLFLSPVQNQMHR